MFKFRQRVKAGLNVKMKGFYSPNPRKFAKFLLQTKQILKFLYCLQSANSGELTIVG